MPVVGRSAHRVGKIFRLLAVALVYSVCLLLLLRMCSANPPRAFRSLAPNDRLQAAYKENGSVTLLYQNGDTITRSERAKGYFAVPEYYYIPEANEVQLLFRYNNSTLEHVKEDYSIATQLSREGDWFDLSLVLTKSDGTEERIHATKVEKDLSRRLYVFYRLTFDGVVIDEDTTGLFADVYYLGDVDYEKDAYGTICLYDPATAWLSKKVTNSELRQLAR